LRWSLGAAAIFLGACASAAPDEITTTHVASTSARPDDTHPLSRAETVTCSRASPTNPTFLVAVTLRGIADKSTCSKIASFAGAPIDAVTIESDIHALYATGKVQDVVVATEEEAGQTTLVFDVVQRPRLAALTIEGAPKGVDADAAIGDHPGRFDVLWERGAEARILDALQTEGFRHATVGHDVKLVPGKGAEVRITIVPGAILTLGAVRFEGLSKANDTFLRAPLLLRPGAPVPADVVERDGLVVQAGLYDLGLVESSVATRTEENPTAGTVDVVFTVTEGPQYSLGRVRVKGPRAFEPARYKRALAPLKSGAMFVRTTVANVVQDLESIHREADAPAHVDVETRLDPKKHVIDVDLVIQ